MLETHAIRAVPPCEASPLFNMTIGGETYHDLPHTAPYSEKGATMAKLSVREAAKRFDVSRPTLVKHLKNGKISGEPLTNGGWLIDPAEMIRAGYAARLSAVNEPSTLPGKITITATSGLSNHKTENNHLAENLNAKLAATLADLEKERILRSAAEQLAAERAAHIEDLRRMLPAPQTKAGRRSGWWPW